MTPKGGKTPADSPAPDETDENGQLGLFAAQALSEPASRDDIHQRIDHVHAFTAGLAATELAPRGKAARELGALFAWITQGALL